VRWPAPAPLALSVALLALSAGGVTAQATGLHVPGWAGDPSPLALLGDLPRPGSFGAEVPVLLLDPVPRAGLHWAFGNPAALPFEMADERAEFRIRHGAGSGDYRRPLDPERVSHLAVSGGGWQRVGEAGAVSGGVAVDRATLDGLLANVLAPYGMSPHVYADTSGAALGRLSARLEGAGGWRVGDWGLGVATGYETWSARTELAAVPRFQRGVMPGITVGVTRALPVADLLVGAHGRWQARVEATGLSARTAPTTIFLIEGHTEPTPVDLSPPSGFSRRFEREARAAGFGAAARVAGIRWTASGERLRLGEKQTWVAQNEPPSDRWDAAGHAAGLAAQGDLPGGLGSVVAGVRWTRITGDAVRHGIEEEGSLFAATEEVLEAGMEVRLRPHGTWAGAARFGLGQDQRVREDRVAGVDWSIRAWRPSATLEGTLALSPRLALGLGASAAWYTPRGSIPKPDQLGPNYRMWTAPELAYYANPAFDRSLSGSARWITPGGSVIALHARHAATSPRPTSPRLPYTVDGERRRWEIQFGVLP
jgi:hypothetical protein